MSDFFIPDFIEICGGRPLAAGASVGISGAKNLVLGAMCAAILTDQPVVFDNVPYISDVVDMIEIMRGIGIEADYSPELNRAEIRAARVAANTLPDQALNFRASYYIWGALLARFAKTGEFSSLKIRIPGGCSFGGARMINYHVDLLQNMFGAALKESGDMLEFVLPEGGDADAHDDSPIYSTMQVSHGATFHWLLSAALSPRAKMIYNASQEPEVPALLSILNAMGANLRGTGTTAITNMGFSGNLLSGGRFEIMPDRMEAGFYALLAMALKSRITLNGTDADSCRPWLNSVVEIAGGPRCRVDGGRMDFDFRDLPPFDGRTYVMSPIPGKETDMQQVWTPILAMAATPSKIYDPVWPGRVGHLAEMAKFGLNSESRIIKINNSVAPEAAEILIRPSEMRAATASGTDLRGTAGLIICAAMAAGRSRIDMPKFALRGYPNLIRNLQSIGVDAMAG